MIRRAIPFVGVVEILATAATGIVIAAAPLVARALRKLVRFEQGV